MRQHAEQGFVVFVIPVSARLADQSSVEIFAGGAGVAQ